MAGSDTFKRTKSFDGPQETDAKAKPVHIAIVYQADGTITAFRNGELYGTSYLTGFQTFAADQAQVVFGLRHSPPGGNRLLKGRILEAALFDRALESEEVAAWADEERDYISEKTIMELISPADRESRLGLKKRLAEATKRVEELSPRANRKVYSVVSSQPSRMKVHIRGSVTDFGEEVSPAGISAIRPLRSDFGLGMDASDVDRRRQLANWITDHNNPLFTRVAVNRVWHHHFGTGIVDTPNDFGFNGGRPSHPRLLDWLALRFRESGYSLKALHKLIVMSATYRQSSAMNRDAAVKDSSNRLLWRYSPRRIDAEVLRDSLLEIAGVLNRDRGGPGFRDVDVTFNNGTTYYEPIDPEGDEFHRRTIYRFTPRGGRSALLDTFDCPDPSATTPNRSVTTTPLQALSLLNNSLVLRMSQQTSERIKDEVGTSHRDQVAQAWKLFYGRDADDQEAEWAIGLVDEHGLAALCRALFNSNEFIIIE